MGTDVYMEWKGKKKEDKDKQMTGFSIDSGEVGYLRASIGMVNENSFLRKIFPNEIWEGGKGIRYEFTEQKFNNLLKMGVVYLLHSLTGKEITFSEQTKHQQTGNNVLQLLKNLGWKDSQITTSSSCDFRSAVMWLNSLLSFYELGMELEEKKKEPKVYISW